MGKSGHIGHKIAATLASTGSPAFFVHSAEASHGDFGMITAKDVVLAISNSGETEEIVTLVPLIKHMGVPLITMTGNPLSTLALAANINLDVSVTEEACPLGLAPTSSTTATLAMGDAIAIALLEARGFTAADFARSHPGGRLGRRLLLQVEDIMRTGDTIPKVTPDMTLTATLVVMSEKAMGMTAIVSEQQELLGIYTNGDLRRTLDRGVDIRGITMNEVMIRRCKTIRQQMLAVEALQMMEEFKITSLLVIDDNNILIGAVHMHDLLRAGVA
jgi:arabinose-5-phosphate isomerase